MKRRVGSAALAAALSLLGLAPPAQAFCNATSCDPSDAKQHCQIDPSSLCVLSGHPLFWTSGCVGFSIQKDAAPRAGIDYDAVQASLQRAFAAWTGAACDGGSPSLQLEIADPVTCDKVEYNKTHRNANIVMFREDVWPYEGGEDALGLTRVHFDPLQNLGELWDTDIEVNAVAEKLSVGKPKSDEVDLDSLLTHELGHALGLGHSINVDATMIAGYVRGSIGLRTLGQDDVDGVCSLYPPGRQAATNSCAPRHGFSELCGADQPASEPPIDPIVEEPPKPKSSACSVSAAGPGASDAALGGWVGVASLGLVCAAQLRRRRRAKR